MDKPTQEELLKAAALLVGDWVEFAEEVFGIHLDEDQRKIVRAVQHHKMVSVASGTARGKDFVAAVCCLCFLYTAPVWDAKGDLLESAKVAMTAPSDRQVENIMVPEVRKLYHRAQKRGYDLPGRLVAHDIRTEFSEWFLTGFKADDTKAEVWSGFHAPHVMFVVTEASGMSELVFNSIEGNLQGDSRLLLVFNPNISVGYAAKSQKSPRWQKFRLDSLTAPNVVNKKIDIPGQVDYDWVKDKVETWATPIQAEDYLVEEGDFLWEGQYYRPDDLFRVKVRGMFPKVSGDTLIPPEWVEAAQKRWVVHHANKFSKPGQLRLGVDVAGMGRDSSVLAPRYTDLLEPLKVMQSAGKAAHMEITGVMFDLLKKDTDTFIGRIPQAMIDTIGEGAGSWSRANELVEKDEYKLYKNRVHSAKFSNSADILGSSPAVPMRDRSGQYSFLNMRAWLFWAVRDWLNPFYDSKAMLPPDDLLAEEMGEIKWEFMSNGKIKIEPKEDIIKRLKRSPDRFDALALTFWPVQDYTIEPTKSGAGKAAKMLPF